MLVTVDTDRLLTPDLLAVYGQPTKHSYVVGIRIVLEALGIELPPHIKPKAPGVQRRAVPSKSTLWRDKKRAETAAQATATPKVSH